VYRLTNRIKQAREEQQLAMMQFGEIYKLCVIELLHLKTDIIPQHIDT